MNIIQQGNISTLTSAVRIDATLPTGTYDVQFDSMRGIYELHHRPGFRMPTKIYGGVDTFSTRVLKTFRALGKGMAVLASGPKGCGKTLTAKRIALESEMPVICVATPYFGSGFNAFLTDIPNACVVFIDEFEKLYNEENARNSFLSLLDGASDNKHLFILTSNEAEIGRYFSNRPGRVRYHRKYEEMPMAVLHEMIEDMMEEGWLRDAVVKMIEEYGSISPDALTSLITECLIHGEPPEEFLSYFNIQTELSGYYSVVIKRVTKMPKTGLTKATFEKVKRYLERVEQYGEEYAAISHPEGLANCNDSIKEWSAEYTRPFSKRAGEMEVNINYATSGVGKSFRSFNFRQHEIESMRRYAGNIEIKLHSGDTYLFTPVAGSARGKNAMF